MNRHCPRHRPMSLKAGLLEPQSDDDATRHYRPCGGPAKISQGYVPELQGMAEENARLAHENMLLRTTRQGPIVLPVQSHIRPPPGLDAEVSLGWPSSLGWLDPDCAHHMRRGLHHATYMFDRSTCAGSSPSASLDSSSNRSRESSTDGVAYVDEPWHAAAAQYATRLRSPPALQLTTVMMRNLPDAYTRQMVLDLLVAAGYEGSFDLVYVPINFDSNLNLGCAFVNFVEPDAADTFRRQISGFSDWCVPSDKVCEATWGEARGLSALIDRYRNSPVMHDSVPEQFKPALFRGFERIPFPPPTKRLRPPRNLRRKR